ncbi:hypothetical protein BDZ94DRAFT_1199801 [Collybia nuda]|uniref:G domain-containing protein n=1 Tax=Collybia nuda TaxID=64659 RepID=A0A9P5XX64_9AGAR|nr:hypothetical protein BDZ94DRAFT_1199801 [Collybia nuda]
MAGRFRILVIGRANAGKTTILKRICDTTDEPEIYNINGKKIDKLTVEPTNKRGFHDINNEMVFRSNPDFIFHDSRGFEAGGTDELQQVKDFVSRCSKEKGLANQLHVIWYCIPMDSSRPITHAEVQFFSKLGTGKVPVVVIFTKSEALELNAVNILQEQKGLDFKGAVKEAADYAKEYLQMTHLILEKYKYPPKGHVYLQGMEKSNTDCRDLVECTANVLDSVTLQAIFVSMQQVNIEISIKFSIIYILDHFWKKGKTEEISGLILITYMRSFPYWVSGYLTHETAQSR